MDKKTIAKIKKFQLNEITEYHVYHRLAKIEKNKHNSKILTQIADDELRHYNFWMEYTKTPIKPNFLRVNIFIVIAKIFGLTFALKFMEKGEINAQKVYGKMRGIIDDVDKVIEDEGKHEQELIGVLKEKKLEYIGSIVLGLNDALVELTGVLAGLTLALQNMKLIALTGLITGIAASFSMGASEYLSQKSDGNDKTAVTSSIYTWVAYFLTVFLLILPYLFCNNPFIALGITLGIAVLIILGFNFYISVAKGLNFKRRFWEMIIISFGVASLSFGIGWLLKMGFNLDL